MEFDEFAAGVADEFWGRGESEFAAESGGGAVEANDPDGRRVGGFPGDALDAAEDDGVVVVMPTGEGVGIDFFLHAGGGSADGEEESDGDGGTKWFHDGSIRAKEESRGADGVDRERVGDADDAERRACGDDDTIAGLREIVPGADLIDKEGKVIEMSGDFGLQAE